MYAALACYLEGIAIVLTSRMLQYIHTESVCQSLVPCTCYVKDGPDACNHRVGGNQACSAACALREPPLQVI